MFNTIENKLLKLSLEAFNKDFGHQMGMEIEVDESCQVNGDLKTDALLKIKIQSMELIFCAEIKYVVNKSVIGFMLHQQSDFPYDQLLVTNYVNPVMADKLRINGINFIDAAGNAYINTPPVFIFVKGNKAKNKQRVSFQGKAFTLSGLKMVYALLCNEELLNRSYREIAKTSGIALGTVGLVIGNLKKLDFVLDMGARGKKIVNKKTLFDRWCLNYVEKLRPKLLLGRFEGPEDFWKWDHLDSDFGQWGGEVAAFKLTNYLKPQNVIIYAKEKELKNIILQNRLNRTENGNIEIFKSFWPDNKAEVDKSIVHPFIIYADLLGINKQRTIETAKVIYEKNIAGYFRKS